MSNGIKLAIFAAASAIMSAAAVAQVCPPGRYYQTGICYPIGTTGEVIGGAANAAGAILGGTVDAAGALAGGAVNAAGQVVGGTVGAVTGQPPYPPAAPTCPPGYVLYLSACYPAR